MSNALSSTANDFLHEMSQKFTQCNQIDPKASTSSAVCGTMMEPALWWA